MCLFFGLNQDWGSTVIERSRDAAHPTRIWGSTGSPTGWTKMDLNQDAKDGRIDQDLDLNQDWVRRLSSEAEMPLTQRGFG
ncbi:hypothetical protein, partial [Sphingobacterium sp.]|uniref:hypothetical protein n=1 Tax=Sphingobacterium sp. TaxID=341027 RepID=UPI0028AA0209